MEIPVLYVLVLCLWNGSSNRLSHQGDERMSEFGAVWSLFWDGVWSFKLPCNLQIEIMIMVVFTFSFVLGM